MERNAHRLTLHSPAGEILHLMGKSFFDFAQLKWRFKKFMATKKCKFTTIYCDATTMQHHQSKRLT
ncbi:hypothetical protein C3387_01215 [Leclercia sp. LSNIH6]|nr:hypothetical protein DVA43_05130 [Leclercia sp. W6]POU77164.1 hypothetical protein C3370_01215 [Leclercia sp. LSNIH7]POU79620.1 hypothetical protein C3387_01215 [Leclercia sp. LSNIH6]POW51744.1 hypothetical protein C3406_08760 [Leclercia sp. LSNIH8]